MKASFQNVYYCSLRSHDEEIQLGIYEVRNYLTLPQLNT